MSDRILVAIDGSDPAEKALEEALALYGDGEIVAISVVDPAEASYGLEGDVGDAHDHARQEVEDRLRRARERAQDRGVSIETEIVGGEPARVIVEYAEDEGVDHVFLGSHGRTGVSRILLGSVAETVVRRSPVPVTVVR